MISKKRTSDSSEPSTKQLRRKDLVLGLCAPILLIGVAVTQHVLVTTHDLNPWKGGGFGMFATVDSPGDRTVYTVVTKRDGSIHRTSKPVDAVDPTVGLPTSRRMVTFPNDEELTKAAMAALRNYDLFIDDPGISDDDAVSATVEIHSIAFDSKTSTVTSTLIRSLTVEKS